MKANVLWLSFLALVACRQADAPNEPANAMENGPETKAEEGQIPAPVAPSSAAAGPADSGRVSQYSALNASGCRLVEESDEGPYWRRRCPGVGGYAVDHTESDLRQGLAVIPASIGKPTSLELSSKVAKGAFNTLGNQIEWRGSAGKAPDALILRVKVANGDGTADRSLLAVAKLAPTPCLIGVVEPGAKQNVRARALADAGGTCL